MTDKKISELDAITGSNTAATDVFVVVDTSTGQTKKITREELNNAIEQDVLSSIDIDTINGDFTVNGNINLGDNNKAIFGAGSDLQIYHDGSNSYIDENGTGNLFIKAEHFYVRDQSNDNLMRALSTGEVNLYHSGSQKLATTATGIDVTGTVTADGLTVANTGIPTITIQDQDGTNQRAFFKQSASTTIITSQDGTSYGEFLLSAYNGTNTLNRLRVFSGGDISFYEDTGTTAKLTWDASAESLRFADNSKAIFGAVSDLQIYHDGSNSAIQNATGELFVYGGGDQIRIRAENGEESIVANPNGSVDLYHNGSAKMSTTNQGINVTGLTETDTIYSSGLITTTAMSVNHSNGAKFRQYSMSAGSGGGAWLLGKIKHGGSADGGVSGKLCFAHDYGSTTDSPNIHFTFQQRSGVARGHWWYENTDDDAGSDNVSVKLIDDGSGGMFVWVVASDYVNCSVEASWRQVSESYLSDSGTLSAGTITTGTTLLDTANDPTAEMHIGKLFAHNNIDVTGMVTAEGLTIIDDYPQIIFTDTNNNPDWTLIGANGRIGFYDLTNAVEVATINSTGINVAGTVTADGLTVSGGSNQITLDTSDQATYGRLDVGHFSNGAFIGTYAGTNAAANILRFGTSGGEKARLDASGNLLVGTTDTTIFNDNADEYGFMVEPTGQMQLSANNATMMYLNRQNGDGAIVDFRKDGTTVGSIGSISSGGSQLRIGDTSTGLCFRDDQVAVVPANSTSLVDNTTDLGNSAYRFKDLHLSGTAYAGNVVSQVAINAQTGTAYTTVLTDQSKLVTLTNASAITFTIPANSSVAYPIGTQIDLSQFGAGQVTVAGASGVTVNSASSLKLRAQYSSASCIKVATDTWLLVGDLEVS
jgi:hypothetical protein